MIEFQQVTKTYGTQTVLDGVSFRINPGERVGIVGPNGAGKSTLLNMVTGEVAPDRGVVVMPRNSRLGYVHQQLALRGGNATLLDYAENALPALQAIQHEIAALEATLGGLADPARAQVLRRLGELQTRFEHQGGYGLKTRAEATLGGLGFATAEFARPFAALSGGWQMRAELARALVADPDILLLDEPSNYLDIPAVEWLQRFLRDYAGTLVLISHDRFLLNSLTQVTVEVANGGVTRFAGNYAFYVEDKRVRFDHLHAARRNFDRKREKAERFIERFRAKNTKASLVKSKIKMLERMENVELPRAVVSPGRIRLPPPPPCGHEVLRLEGAGVSYDGERWVLRGVDLAVERGDKTALVGLNGTGKTTLLRVVAGLLAPSEGRRRLGHNVTVGYQSQEFADTMNPRDSVFATVKSAGPDITEQEARNLLGSFGFSGDAIEKPVAVLSGGEKVRLAFARILVRPPSLLLLDEPTTHLDIPAREALEEALGVYEGTVCLVSHDIEFVRAVATGIIAMAPPGIRRFWGGFDYYHDKLAQEQAAAGAAAVASAPPSPASERRQARRERAERVQEYSRLTRDLKKRVRAAEERAEQLEREQAELTAQLSSPPANLNYAEVNRRLAELQAAIGQTTADWEAAAAELDELDRAHRGGGSGA